MFTYVKGEKTQLDILELQLDLVMKHSMDAGNQNLVLCKNSRHSYLLCHLSSTHGAAFLYLGVNTFKVIKFDH